MTDEQSEKGPFQKLVESIIPPVNIGEWMPTVFTFTAAGPPYEIQGRGTVIEVKNPGNIVNPGKYMHTYVTIDGVKYKVRGVGSYRPSLPYPDHLTFAFMVEETDTNGEPAKNPTRKLPALPEAALDNSKALGAHSRDPFR